MLRGYRRGGFRALQRGRNSRLAADPAQRAANIAEHGDCSVAVGRGVEADHEGLRGFLRLQAAAPLDSAEKRAHEGELSAVRSKLGGAAGFSGSSAIVACTSGG